MKFSVADLVKVLKKNRTAHAIEAKENLAGFRKLSIAEMEKNLAKAKAGGEIIMYINRNKPKNNTKDYDRVLQMLGMTSESEVALTQMEFS